MDDATSAAVVERAQEMTAEQADNLSAPLRKASRIILSVLVQLLGIVVGLVIGGALIASSGADPIEAYRAVVVGAFGDVYNFSETLVKATPILLAALGVVVAFRCSVWNIGSEGQLRMGALAATTIGILAVGLPLPKLVLVPLMIAAGFFAGGAWGALAGWLKVRWNVNEIIGTIMLNFIASFFVNYMITHPLREPTGGGVPLTMRIAEAGQLPRLFSNMLVGARLHVGIIIALFAALLVYLFLWHTVPGYRIRAVGANPRAALLGGIDIGGSVIVAMLISGGLAGVGGMVEIAGLHYRLIEGFSPNYGATAILVALLGRSHPVGVVIASILFGGLIIGTDAMTRAVEVPGSIVFVLQGLIVLSMLAADLIAKRLKVTE
jgi:ABC-type uncharacterized transport system permease subunit